MRNCAIRRFGTSSGLLNRLQAAAAPPPTSLPKARPRMGKWKRRGLILGGVGLTFYTYDKIFNASALIRSGRCVVDLLLVGLDYKLNFKEGRDIDALHERSAERIYNLMIKNKGLYIKMGQAVAVQAGIFPPSFQEKFGQLFDSAPQDTWAEVENLLTTEYNEPPDQFFEFIDHRAVASASIAQVHKAKLKTGEWVAVKVQHADLEKQVSWDLSAYRWLMWIYDRYLFKFPIYFFAEHITEQLQREVDFRNELENGDSTRNSILNDPTMNRDLYVPKNYPSLSTSRVLVSEWIEGVPLSNQAELKRQGFDTGKAMSWIIKLYARQIFSWGKVHCDPHPGNVILRRVPGSSRQQVVLIDHGLYINENDKFRRQYTSLWEGMFTADTDLLKSVASEWGFGDGEMLASGIMMRAYKPSSEKRLKPHDHEVTPQEEFQQHNDMREKFRTFLSDTTKIPLELIFLGRTMRIVQGLNRKFGSPVNRIKVFAREASVANRRDSNKTFFKAWKDYFVFWGILIVSDVGFLIIRLKQLVLGSSTRGAEDFIDEQMKEAAKEMGIEYEEESGAV